MADTDKYQEWYFLAKGVIKHLDRYRGGKIVAHQHGLHLAVQELEQCTEQTPWKTSQKGKLPDELARAWYRLLDLSRGDGDYDDERGDEYQHWRDKFRKAGMKECRLLEANTPMGAAFVFRQMLLGACSMMSLLHRANGSIPYNRRARNPAYNDDGTERIPISERNGTEATRNADSALS